MYTPVRLLFETEGDCEMRDKPPGDPMVVRRRSGDGDGLGWTWTLCLGGEGVEPSPAGSGERLISIGSRLGDGCRETDEGGVGNTLAA